ncbi:hypothetical protein EV193_10147 [Herbihabitans rhizosphaerae]|uniref:Uncharacterized protein n=1 Tax=Herbihabitans rhizosphaerae TaxID=1872711 RepID=A0A4Q7L766_9PSEU|nr:hypothetical protein [Herbihabitans rhizosphaerae]RZS44172.1 hypothetical protein EV193_10147 [Herbihabitans rhizosphaerae]
MTGDCLIKRQVGGVGHFAHVHVRRERTSGAARVVWSVAPDDRASAQPGSDPAEVDAALAGASEMVNLLRDNGFTVDGHTVHLARVIISLVDTEPTAVRASAAMATAIAYGAGDLFEVRHDGGWRVTPAS